MESVNYQLLKKEQLKSFRIDFIQNLISIAHLHFLIVSDEMNIKTLDNSEEVTKCLWFVS